MFMEAVKRIERISAAPAAANFDPSSCSCGAFLAPLDDPAAVYVLFHFSGKQFSTSANAAVSACSSSGVAS
jgi:hypothetical protein